VRVKNFLALSLIAITAGCVNTPTVNQTTSNASQILYQQHVQSIANINQFSLQGRIGVQTDGKGFSGSLTWQHDAINDNIALYSPLGGQVANIKRTSDKVTLDDGNGHSISAKNVAELTQSTLGWQLPLEGLADWSLGRPSSSHIRSISWDDRGLLSTLKQDDWDIQYQNYTDTNGIFLPSKILLKSEKVNLKLLIEKWFSLGSIEKSPNN
jgi:outer membrane lipoprotein LolB